MNSLTEAQLDGRACIVCGRDDRPMTPIYVETPTSTMVFRCVRCDCTEEQARAMIAGSIPASAAPFPLPPSEDESPLAPPIRLVKTDAPYRGARRAH